MMNNNQEKQMETVMPQTSKPEAAEVMQLLGTMNQSEQQEMLTFLRGVEFGKRLAAAGASA